METKQERNHLRRLIRNMILLLLTGILCLTFISPYAAAADRVIDLQAKDSFWLSDQVAVLPEEPAMDESQALRLFEAGTIDWVVSGNPGFGYDRSEVWLAFEYRPADAVKAVVEFGYAPLDQVSVYTVLNGSGGAPQLIYRSGDQFPVSERIIEHRRLIVPLPAVAVEDAVHTVLVHVKSSGSLKIPIRLSDEDALANQNAKESVFDGIYFGAFLLVSLLNVMNYLTFRHRKYLIYIGSVLSLGFFVATYKGYGAAYIWPDQFWLNQYAIIIFVQISVFLMAWFSIDFLDLRKTSPVMSKVLYGYLGLNVIFLLVCYWLPYTIASKIAAQDSLICSLLLTIAGLLRFRHDRKAFLFSLAFLFQLTGIALTAVTVLGIMPSYPWAEHSVQVGSFLQMTLLFLALSDEIQQIRREKEAADAERIMSDAKRLEAIAESVRLQEQNRQQLAEWNAQLENKVTEKTNALKQLLDHSEEGFFTIEADGRTGPDFSAACIVFFGDGFAGADCSVMLTKENPENQLFLMQVIRDVFSSGNAMQRDIYLSLLPDALRNNQRILKIRYQWVEATGGNRRHILCIVTDLTGEETLKSALETERIQFEMVVTVFTQQEAFVELISCMDELISEQLPYWQRIIPDDPSVAQSALRTVHTLKGQSDQLKMSATAGALHDMEDELITNGQLLPDALVLVRKAWMQDHEILGKWLDKRLIVQQSMVSIERHKLIVFRDLIAAGAAHDQLLHIVNAYLNVPVSEMLSVYKSYVERIARTLDKWVKTVEITGEHVEVDRERFQPFIRSLVHVFRNMIDHGIEPAEERLERNKDEWGTIRCHLALSEGNLMLTIEDDGKGIHPDEIRLIAVQRMLIPQQEADQLSDGEMIAYIWRDGFSTKDHVTELSGRGVGLSAVQEQVLRLNGTVKVVTVRGKGTAFEFVLPLQAEKAAVAG